MKNTLNKVSAFKQIFVILIITLFGVSCTPCKLDNSDLWRPTAHGDYNCIGKCNTGKCQLEVLVNETWTRINMKRQTRNAVDAMAGQPIPVGTEPPQTEPT